LIKLPVAGGASLTLAADVLGSEGRGAWLDDGRVVFADRTRLAIVPADGGKREWLVTSTQMAGYNPVIVEPLPGAAGIVMQTCPSQCPRAVIYSVDLRTKAVKMLIPDGRNPTYLPSGHLAWITSAGVLVAAPFDADKLELRGEPVPVLEPVAAISVSRGGRLVYREGEVGEAAQVAWVDRAGRASIVDSSWVAHISSFGLSPDGRRLATSIVAGGQQQLWIKDLPRGTLSKFTFGALNHFRPVWSADARRIWYVAGDTTFGVMEQNTDGSVVARPVKHEPWRVVEAVASRDGNWLVMRTGGTDTTRALLALRLGVDSVARRLDSGPASKLGVALSPDSRFIAFSTGLSGQPEIYVSPFPNIASARWQVSSAGGYEARWSNDGRELFYVNIKNELVAAKVNTTGGFAVVSSQTLFDVSGYVRDGGFHVYEQEPGGNRFLMLKKVVFPGELVLVDNWFAELRDKLRGPR
jgi:serine/threonine-protein kinase